MSTLIKKYRKVLVNLATIIIVLFFGYYIYSNKEDFLSLLGINLLYVALIIFLKIFVIYLNGLFTKVISNEFGLVLGSIESFFVSILSSITNSFTPLRGGAGVRAIYLKQKYNFSYSFFISTLSGNYIIVFMLSSVLSLCTLVYLHLSQNIYSIWLYLIFSCIFIVTFLLSLKTVPVEFLNRNFHNKTINRLASIIYRVVNGWNTITKNKQLLVKLLLLIIGTYLAGIAVTFLEYKALHIGVTIPGLILFISITQISLLISITPGSLGISEMLLVFSSGVLGATSTEILQISIVDRTIAFVTLSLLYIISKVFSFEKMLYKK